MTHLTIPADLDNAKIQTSRSDHDQRSRNLTTVLLYIHDIRVWYCLWQQLGVRWLTFLIITISDMSYCLWLFLFWFHRLSASASKDKKFINQLSFCSVSQLC